jgi:hypothetical protein
VAVEVAGVAGAAPCAGGARKRAGAHDDTNVRMRWKMACAMPSLNTTILPLSRWA